jgi:hypothetical protein
MAAKKFLPVMRIATKGFEKQDFFFTPSFSEKAGTEKLT